MYEFINLLLSRLQGCETKSEEKIVYVTPSLVYNIVTDLGVHWN